MSKTPELTQADLDKALQHAITNCHWHGEGQKPRWSVVMDVTGHGSTYAAMLCRWAGENPDDPIDGDCNGCEHLSCKCCGEPRGEGNIGGVCRTCTEDDEQ